MAQEKVRKLTRAGFEVGSVDDFLELTPEEIARVEEVRAEAAK